MEEKKRSTDIQSIGRVLQLFDLLAEGAAMGVIDISKELGVTRTAIYSLITPLLKASYLEKDEESGKYRLGYKFYELGKQYRHHYPFTAIAETYARQLSRKTRLQVNMAVFKAPSTIVLIISADITEQIKQEPQPVISAHVSSCGKVLLASLDEKMLDEAIASIEFLNYTANTIMDGETLRKELEEVRRLGYATEKGELFSSKGCIGAPVRGAGGKTLAALSVDGELADIESRFEELRDLVVSTAAELSRELGYKMK